ncbi:MAG: hypothetical protein ACK2T6_06685 [Anaerolineae bacterium]
MQCDIARILMDERLDGAVAPGLDEHLASCRGCASEWSKLEAAERLLATQDMAEPPAHLASRVTHRIELESRLIPDWQRTLMQVALIAVGAVLLALATAAFVHGWAQVLRAPVAEGQVDSVIHGAGKLSGLLAEAVGPDAVIWPLYAVLAVALAIVWFGALVVPRFAPRSTR